MSNFQPVNSNPTDGELITLCKILEAVSTGGGGGGDSDVAVGADGVTRVPLNVNADGELKVNVEASINADLTDIENALATSNGILTTTAVDTATIKAEAISIDGKLPALSSGRVPVEANNAASQVYNYTATGAVSANTVLIGPIECDQFREVNAQSTSVGTGMLFQAQISNNSTTWTSTQQIAQNSNISVTSPNNAVGVACYSTLGARYFRIVSTAAQTAGTTTLVAYASQQATPKLYQSVTLTGIPPIASYATPAATIGFSSYFTLISAASTNATSIKTSSGTIGTLLCQVNSGQTCYLKIFNKSSAPVVGTDTPVLNIPIHPGAAIDVGTAFAGMRLTNGIAIAVTRGQALLDSTPTAAGEAVINLTYV